MTLEIKSADSSLADFVDLPFILHKNRPLWAPGLKKQDSELLDPHRHPFWQSARRKLWLAWRDNVPVGRIAAIIDDKYNNYAGEACGAFGFFECENSRETGAALLDHASDWLAAQGCPFMRGPLNPSLNYTCGVLVDGFDLAPSLMMPWNPPHYPELLERSGLRKEQDLFAYVIDRAAFRLPPLLATEIARIKRENRFTFRPSSKATLSADIRAMLAIYKKAWAQNWGFSPLSPKEETRLVGELKTFLDPDFFVLFFDDKKPVAGMVGLPDLNPLLKRLNGRIGLAAPWRFWQSRKEIRSGLRIMLFGILPEYRLAGLPLLLVDYMLDRAAQKPGLEWLEGSWILEDNFAMNELMEDFGARLKKRYRIYRRELSPC